MSAKPAISIVPSDDSLVERARRLQAEADVIGEEVVQSLLATLYQAASAAETVATLLVVPAGVRDRSRRLAGAIKGDAASIEMLLRRIKS